MEYKSISSEPLQIEDRTVTGLASVLGNTDAGNDVIFPGAYTKTIRESKQRFRHLWNHDDAAPPTAVIRDIREIGYDELPSAVKTNYPDAKGGLLVKREYLDTPRGNETLAGVRAGAINEMSVGFVPVKKQFVQDGSTRKRHIHEINFFESSDVLWGMNDATMGAITKGAIGDLAWAIRAGKDVTSLIAAGMQFTPDAIAQMDNALKLIGQLLMTADPSLPEYMTDTFKSSMVDLFSSGAASLKAGRKISAANLTKIRQAMNDLQELINTVEPSTEPDDASASEAEATQKALTTKFLIARTRLLSLDEV